MASAAEQLAANMNFGSFQKATELHKRIGFTVIALIVYRLGTYIPIPGIDPVGFAKIFDGQSKGFLGIFDMFSGGAVQNHAIFALNDRLSTPSREWIEFFVEAIGAMLIEQSNPRGYVSPEAADWLIARIEADGQPASAAELELLVHLAERASAEPTRLKAFALAQLEAAVLTGSGPTRDGERLDPGCINAAEAKLLRRLIFASGGDGPACVSKGEAELLFRLKDATLNAANAPEWQQLFVQGVGNYLQGMAGAEAPSAAREAELAAHPA